MQAPETVRDRVFIVGAQRCGTTYLYRLLEAHPEISMARPVRPEPKIFLSGEVTDDPQAYDARLFAGRPATRIRGEKTTSYLEHPASLDRIAKTFPDAHIVVAVRDPIERALSNYRFTVDAGLEDRTADAALLADLEGRHRPYDHASMSASPYAYVRRGRYLRYLRRVDERFDRERIHVVVYEEFTAGTDVIRTVYAALGVDERHVPGVAGTVINPSAAPATLSTDTRDRLRAYYADANAALERHLGRSLRVWH